MAKNKTVPAVVTVPEGFVPVVVCTDKDKRGIFFGYVHESKFVAFSPEPGKDGETIDLLLTRMCVYFSKETRGVLGLASIGPQKGSRISPSVASQRIHGVTTIMTCSPEAAAIWETGPWTA